MGRVLKNMKCVGGVTKKNKKSDYYLPYLRLTEFLLLRTLPITTNNPKIPPTHIPNPIIHSIGI